MAYVNFWKGPAADYVAGTHGEGIYQCTDTGDTYIFGVKNSGKGGDGESNSYHILDWAEDLAGGNGTLSANAVEVFEDILGRISDGKGLVPLFIRYQDIATYAPETSSEAKDWLAPTIIQFINSNNIQLILPSVGFVSLVNGNPADVIIDVDYPIAGGLYYTLNFVFTPDGSSGTISLTNNGVVPLAKTGDGTKFLSDDGSYKTPTMDLATPSSNGLMSASDKSKLDSLKGTNSNQSFQNGVSNIPLATYGIQLRQISSNGTLSFSGSLSDGQELHVIIHNTNNVSAITITFPSSSSYISMSGDSMEIPANGYLEVNVLRAGSYYYLRAAVSLE